MDEAEVVNETDAIPARIIPTWRVYFWPVSFIAASLLFCFAIPQIVQLGPSSWMDLCICMVIGMSLGMVAFTVCLAGLWRRTWLSAFFVGIGLCWLGLSFGSLGSLFDWRSMSTVEFNGGDGFVFVLGGVLPSCVLLSSASLLTLRFTRNWQLVSPAGKVQQQSLHLIDLFYITIIVGACLAVTRGANTFSGVNSERTLPLSVALITTLSISNIVFNPVATALWLGNWGRVALFGIIGLPIVAIGCTLSVAEIVL